MKKLELKSNTIMIVPSNQKKKLVKEISKEGIFFKKIFTLEEVKKKYYFDYGIEAIYYLMKKYHYQYDVCKMYLSHLYEVSEEDYGSAKIHQIIHIKKDLEEQGLLIYDPFFREYLKGHELLFYNCRFLEKKLIQDLQESYAVRFYQEDKEEYSHECIYEFDTIEEEVVFVADQICSLVEQGTKLSKIKLCGATGEYPAIIKRIFGWFHIPIAFQDSSLFATKIGQDFLKHLGDDEGSLVYIEKNYNMKDPKILEIYHNLISILNQYVWVDSLEEVRDFIIHDLKTTKLSVEHLKEEVEIIDLENTLEDDQVFLLGFNQGDIPKSYKDESYFNDSLKRKLGLDDTAQQNQEEYQKWLQNIKNTKKLTITTKKLSPLGEHYLSSLNDELKLEVKKEHTSYQHSHLYNQLILGEKLDILMKYNEQTEDLGLLYQMYPNLPYQTYDSSYQPIEPNLVKDYLQHKLVLSYSAMNSYYQCAFRYYLANVLKLNIFEETFYTVLGNLFHHVLALSLERKIDVKKEYFDYIAHCTYPFNSRELFFLNHLEKELEFIMQTIQKQNETNSLEKFYAEERIVVEKNREDMEVSFKGFVDKMIVSQNENAVAIIDYKTGNPDLNLNHTIYGLDMQLPTYIYLAYQKFPRARVVGFYLQKILNNEIVKDHKHTYLSLKEDKLKLQGYSNSDLSLLEQFDSSYYESKVIKGMRMNSKGIATKKVLDDVAIERLRNMTEEKIEEAIVGILQANFAIHPKRIGGENLGCKYCTFRDICFRTEKDIVDLKEYKNMEFLGGDE